MSNTRDSGIRVNVYAIISDAVENGIRGGWNRAHKHVDEPDKEFIFEELHKYIMMEICEYLEFDHGEDDDDDE